MRYTKALFLKFVMVTVVIGVVFSLFFGVNFGDIFITSLILTTFAFAVDVFFLPRIGNVMATVGDFVVAFFGIWVLGGYFFEGVLPLVTTSFIAAIIITIGEAIYHRYLRNHVFVNEDYPTFSRPSSTANLQTETSEELDPDIKNKQK
ncbi:YndM family protein [Aquibacillus sediminis]|uniref:YndM family protein n=1 Tax=Aquibacillus sediminis TaxID=2574734 RepID=UPI00110931F9|nr:YndM family protein [Aquibacillus sediminis]